MSPNQPKTPVRTFRPPTELWEQALRIAQQRGETVTSVLIAALQRYVDTHSATPPPPARKRTSRDCEG